MARANGVTTLRCVAPVLRRCRGDNGAMRLRHVRPAQALWKGWRYVATVAITALLVSGGVVSAAHGSVAPIGADVTPTELDAAGGAQPLALTGFNPTNLISDDVFYDGNAMSAAQIQQFLDQKIGACSNGQCINVLSASISSRAAVISQRTGNLVCNAIQGGTMRVAELIYRAQVACGISAKAILVTLQKEQGLVTSRAPSDRNLRAAMGQACPDTAPCDPAFAGIGPQIVSGTTQLKTYRAGAFSRQPGIHFIGYHPNTGCGGTSLDLSNYATTALYNYTPYQPNAAALNAGYGLGDGCSSYGNRNFYNYYTDWFGSTQGGNPFGNIELIESVPGSFRVRGWAIDPNTTAPIEVHVYAGANGYPTVANINRPDVGQAYPASGSQHGFDVRIPAQAGTLNVCIYAINTGPGTNVLLGCAPRTGMTGSPFGSFEAAASAEGGVAVSGWAIDPDLAGPSEVHVYVGAAGKALRADIARPDVAAAYPAYGAGHGFRATIPASVGTYQVCAYAINVGAGATSNLGCRSVTVAGPVDPGRAPLGNFEALTVAGNVATATGWALDPDTGGAIKVQLNVAGAITEYVADKARPDVGAAYPQHGVNHGFAGTVTLPTGQSQVCAFAVNSGSGGNTALGCRTANVAEVDRGRDPIGFFESLSVSGNVATASGWALDPDTSSSIAVHLYINGSGKEIIASRARPDIGAAYPATGPNHGFSEQFTLPTGTSNVCAYGINSGRGSNPFLGCRSVTVAAATAPPPPAADQGRAPLGFFESIVPTAGGAAITGWALDPDTTAPIEVHVYVGASGWPFVADRIRPDVGAAYRMGDNHGFSATVPLGPGTHRVCAYAINSGAGANPLIGCREVSIP